MKISEYKDYIINKYDEYIYYKEHRCISYGEIAYIYSLKRKQLQQLESEIFENFTKLIEGE